MDAEVESQLVDKLVKQISALMVGTPTEGEHIEQGFLSFAQQEAADRDGFYIAPTVLTNVLLDTEAAQEEIFESEDEAINRANQAPHGLSASV
ncbi:aldehyde dehydrogenase family protein [Corynebacterium sp. J010B-136]|uniref:aldehyde dehydrogenase family protein n=1 Tax=Corynebacterium sp. J010B-136 TaxID=2099401 RepID=UPI001E5B4E29|nr:aldehyde dehydrogenase family protein [Corynebacterium sp. J010B-136]